MTGLLPLLYLMFSLNTVDIPTHFTMSESEYTDTPNKELLSANQSANNESFQTVQASSLSNKKGKRKNITKTDTKKLLTENLKSGSVISPEEKKKLILNDQASIDTNSTSIAQQFIDEEISSAFGKRTDPVNKRQKFHKGIDISRPIGTEVFSWDDGVVSQTGWLRGYGLTVDIVHPNGIKTRYAHLKLTKISKGQQISKGQTIGQVGQTGKTTGANLHFELVVAGKLADPLNHLSEDDEIVGHGPISMNEG